ncbi:Holliday junction branch migration DNA helicase RuvB, partial [Candidatus Collierbacteria bacterium]|nr:Holliday junction branch migration DNA helicase RuvB [Candidatus Collierbacteria bacterium]
MTNKINFRADNWNNFIGQDQAVKSIKIAIEAAKKRGSVLEHILLY